MPDRHLPQARTGELVVQDMADEVLVYDIRTNEAHCLNKTAAFIWRNCDGRTPVVEIAGRVAGRFGSGDHTALVEYALDELQSRELMDVSIPSATRGINRRQAVKALGLASTVLIPVVASLVAPSNAFAAVSCTCVNPGGCLSQTTCPSQTNCSTLGVCAP